MAAKKTYSYTCGHCSATRSITKKNKPSMTVKCERCRHIMTLGGQK